MLTAVTNAITTVLGWIGSVIGALTTEGGDLAELLPLLAIGIAISAVMFGIKAIRSVTWGS